MAKAKKAVLDGGGGKADPFASYESIAAVDTLFPDLSTDGVTDVRPANGPKKTIPSLETMASSAISEAAEKFPAEEVVAAFQAALQQFQERTSRLTTQPSPAEETKPSNRQRAARSMVGRRGFDKQHLETLAARIGEISTIDLLQLHSPEDAAAVRARHALRQRAKRTKASPTYRR